MMWSPHAGAVLTSMCIPPNTDTSDMEQWEKDLMIADFCFVLIFTMESIAYTIAIG